MSLEAGRWLRAVAAVALLSAVTPSCTGDGGEVMTFGSIDSVERALADGGIECDAPVAGVPVSHSGIYYCDGPNSWDDAFLTIDLSPPFTPSDDDLRRNAPSQSLTSSSARANDGLASSSREPTVLLLAPPPI